MLGLNPIRLLTHMAVATGRLVVRYREIAEKAAVGIGRWVKRWPIAEYCVGTSAEPDDGREKYRQGLQAVLERDCMHTDARVYEELANTVGFLR